MNSSFLMVPHSKPFNVGTKNGKLLHTLSLPQSLKLLLGEGRRNNVLVVHYYVHNSFYPVSTYRKRVC